MKGIQLPEGYGLDSADSVLRFMREVLIPGTLSGKIGTRQASAITTACKALLDYAELTELEKRIQDLEQQKQNERGQ